MTLRPSTAPQRVPLPSPPASSHPAGPDPAFDSLRAASPAVMRFLATAVTDPLFESTAASALVAELKEEFECFAASVPHLVSMLLAPEGDPDALDIPTSRSYAEAIEGPYSSQWQAAMDAEMASWKSTGTYVDEVPPPRANIVSGMWIFKVKRPPCSPPVFKARYVARGFSQRQGVDFFQTFSPTPKMTTLRVMLHVAAKRDYELHSLDFSTAFLQGSLHEEIWLRCPPGFTGMTLASLGFAPSTSDPSLFLRTDTALPPFYVLVYVDDLVFATADTEALAHVKSELQKRHTCTDLGELTSYLGLRITRDRAQRTITLTQSHMVQQVLQRFAFTYSSPQSTPLPTGHSLSAPPSDESVEPSGPYPELVGCLMYLMTCTRPDLAYPLSLLARYVAPDRHRKVHWDAAKRVLRYLCSTSSMGLVLGGRARVVLSGHADASWVDDLTTSSCEAEIYAGAMAAQELRWLTYLLTDSGEAPRSPLVLYQRGQLRLAYVASQANNADVFTKALQPCDHQPCFTFLTGLCSRHQKRELYVSNTPLRFWSVIAFVAGDVALSSQQHAVLKLMLSEFLGQPAHCLLAARSLPPLRFPAPARPAYCAAMASLRVLAFDHEGRPIQFDTWLDGLQLYLLSDFRDSVSLFDHTSGAAPAPPAKADSATRPQWLTRDAAARFAIRNHLPLAKCAHFGQHRFAQALYDAVVARYSSPATAALGRLLLPYLFPELSAFATVEELVSRLRTALSAEFLDGNPPPMDHFLSLDPIVLTIDLLEQHLLAAETSVVTVGAARGTPHTPFIEGCSPSPLAPSYAYAAAVDVPGAEDVGAASASAKRRTSKGKGGRGGGGGNRSGGGGSSGGGGGGGSGGSGGGSGGFGGGGGGSGGSGGSGSGGSGGGRTGAQRGGSGGGQRQQQQRQSETPSGVAIFDLDYDAILAAMYALSVSAETVTCVCCLTQALHTFTLDSDASRGFFRDSTTLTPLSAPVPVRLADPSGGPVLARSSTVLPCPAVPTSSLSDLQLPSFSTNLPPQVDASAQVTASGQVAPPCSCRLLSHQTLLWHHRLGHPSLPRLRGMHSRLLVSGLPRSLPHLPPSPAPPCLRCVEGRQRAAPHSSSFPPTTAPLQTLHMDVWGPARVSGQGRERYFLLVVDDYTRYTMVSPLCRKGQVVDVLIPWIRTVRLQLRERFRADLPVLRLHSNRGGEFSSDLLREFCRGEGIFLSFTLPDSPQRNGIAERRIGLVMEVARTSMIHAAAPHFLWLFAVRYAAHQLNLWPRVSLPETLPTDVTFDKSVLFYHLFPYRSAPPPPPPLFLAPGHPPVDPLPPQGPAPSSVSQVDPLPGTAPVEVAVGSGVARGAVLGVLRLGFEGAGSGDAEPEGAEPTGAEPVGAEPAGVEPGGDELEGVEPGGA
ncbi:unnamed protein product [Closterium sp. NIES-53]